MTQRIFSIVAPLLLLRLVPPPAGIVAEGWNGPYERCHHHNSVISCEFRYEPQRLPRRCVLSRVALSDATRQSSDRRGGRSASARVHKLITEDIPARVAADTAYQNAPKGSDKQNAC